MGGSRKTPPSDQGSDRPCTKLSEFESRPGESCSAFAPSAEQERTRPTRAGDPASVSDDEQRAELEGTEVVSIIDDNDDVRIGLQRLLESVGHSVRTYASARAYLEQWDGSSGGVLVLDLRMPEMSGLVLQEKLNQLSAVVPIIFLTGHAEVSTAVQAMQHGAFDFIEKPFRSEELLDSIRRALSSGTRAVATNRRRQSAADRIARLTVRERQILKMMTSGKPNKVMAADLSLSQRTVEIHRANVMKKMEADSLASLVRDCLLVFDPDDADTPDSPQP